MAETKSKTRATEKDQKPVDEYHGKYKTPREGLSDNDRWGTNQNPVRETPTPFKNLKKVGG